MLERLVSSRTGLPKFCSMLLEQAHNMGYNNQVVFPRQQPGGFPQTMSAD